MRYLLAIIPCLLIAPPARAEDKKPGPEPLVEKVRKGIEEGTAYLRKVQKERGDWENDPKIPWKGGQTSMALLALLNAGEKPDSEAVQKGLKWLRELESDDTYVVGLQTMVFAEAGFKEDTVRIQRNVKWLIDARVMSGRKLDGWGYHKARSKSIDNSNTQYALLGLWAGKNTPGVEIKPEVWESIREFYISTQIESGGWLYNPSLQALGEKLKDLDKGKGKIKAEPIYSFTMTVAGLCGLIIASQELNDRRETIQKDGTAASCGQYPENDPTAKALKLIGEKFVLQPRPQPPFDVASPTFYNIYGIERAGRLSGLRFIGEHDWYREGCEFLINGKGHPNEDGSWGFNARKMKLSGLGDDSPVVATSFALLFLSKGRTPVLISKLAHWRPTGNDDNDWNNDRSDVRHLVEFSSKELFKKQPLAWQVFNSRQTALEDPKLLAAELLQSPIAYFNGHKNPERRFTDVEKAMLKQYVEQGGFILAEACCGKKEFDEGFRSLVKDEKFLGPDAELKLLPPEHPIWAGPLAKITPNKDFKLYGVETGCKTVVVYSPQDLSCLWEGNQFKDERSMQAFKLGANIVAYATGMEPPKPRLYKIEMTSDKTEDKAPRGYLKVAQIKHGGDWRPAPKAVKNLLLHLREKAGVDVALQSAELFPSDGDLLNYKFMFMHGRTDFEIDNPKVFKANLEKGGATLLADACCGKEAFDKGFRRFMEKVFPDRKLEPIPLDDDLFSAEINGKKIEKVKCRREKAQPGEAGYPEVAPYLEGIKIGKRWVVIYSKYDIGCALEKHQSSDCRGHDYESALRLGTAALMYSLQK